MLKVVFFAIDGIGLGHIRRGINIAKELQRITRAKFLFATNSRFCQFFTEENFNYLTGGADPVEWCNHKISYEEYLRINEAFLISAIDDFCPDIVIFDFIVMPEVIRYVKIKDIFSVYILREINNFDFFIPLRQVIASFDLVLLTGVKNGFFKKCAAGAGFDKRKIFYVGNIFRRPDKKKIAPVKNKYRKRKGEILITISIGGGGGGNDFLREIKKFVLNIFLVSTKINYHNKIRWLFIKGPFFPASFPFPKGIEAFDYERNLTELFSISDLIIATGGYNTVNEIIAARRPALIYPLAHKELFAESQSLRAAAYESKGFIKILKGEGLDDFIRTFKTVLRPGVLDDMKKAYRGFRHPNGARLAARLIKANFFKYTKHDGK